MTDQEEIDAFLSTPRRIFYLWGTIVIATMLLVYFAGLWLLQRELGILIFPLISTLLFIGTFVLSKTPSGRGCLRSIGIGCWNGATKRWTPKTQVTVTGIVAVFSLLYTIWMIIQ
ncbi:MAG: hypothetical protein JXR23_03070 [Pontiellaceae bacterium]|nr:hypothetical protein [Pontiellaceae bacterium]